MDCKEVELETQYKSCKLLLNSIYSSLSYRYYSKRNARRHYELMSTCVDIHSEDDRGATALIAAAYAENPELTKKILKKCLH